MLACGDALLIAAVLFLAWTAAGPVIRRRVCGGDSFDSAPPPCLASPPSGPNGRTTNYYYTDHGVLVAFMSDDNGWHQLNSNRPLYQTLVIQLAVAAPAAAPAAMETWI